MTRAKLALDATVADVVRPLDRPEDYVRHALWNLYQETKKEPRSVITIGATGKGIFPNYKIDVPGDHLDLDILHSATAKVFSGRTHNVINDPNKVLEEHWSTKPLGLEELQMILGEIRKDRFAGARCQS